MTPDQLAAQFDIIKQAIFSQRIDKAETPMVMAGIAIFQEVALDIKRIADATEAMAFNDNNQLEMIRRDLVEAIQSC